MTHPDLNLNLLRMVHARQELTWSRQMRSSEKLSARGGELNPKEVKIVLIP
jgi:hypothetical protein